MSKHACLTSGHAPAEPEAFYELQVCGLPHGISELTLEYGSCGFRMQLACGCNTSIDGFPPCSNGGFLNTPCSFSSDGVPLRDCLLHVQIWDAMLGRLAEVMPFRMPLLQRQSLLPVVHGFANDQSIVISLSGRLPIRGISLEASHLSCASSQNDHNRVQGWLCRAIFDLQASLESMLRCFLLRIWNYVQYIGDWWQQVFVFFVAMAGRYMCQLILFAVPLKGGRYNADNLLHGSRRLCRGCPLDTAVVLEKFSPRLSQRRPPRRLGFSSDLWLVIVLLSALSYGVNAGASSQFNVDSTGFRAGRRSKKLSSAVYNLRSACRNIDSPDTPDDHPDGQPPGDSSPGSDGDWSFVTNSYLFQLFSFGCMPSYLVCSLLEGISLQEAIDQISADTIVPVHDESGLFVPAKGVPFRESVTLVWLPDWLAASRNYLLFVDVSLLGKYPFVIQYHGFAFSYADIAEQLSPIWEDELDHIYIFVPYFSLEPMQADTRFPASNGLTIVLQRDAVAPSCVPDPAEAFRSYSIWGMNVDEADQPPPDWPWPVDKVQMTIDGDTKLFSIGSLSPTQQVMGGLARRFVQIVDDRQVVLASLVPDRHVWNGEPVCQLSAVLSTPWSPDMICVFLVMRGIGRESRASWLRQRDFTRLQFLAAVGLDIAVIPGFKLNVTGGRRMHGQMTCEHGGVLFLNFAPDVGEPEESESETDTSDCDTSISDQNEGPEPCDPDAPADDTRPYSSTSADHALQTPPGELSQRTVAGVVGTALCDTWNLDDSVSSANFVGDRGDTPTDNAARQSRNHHSFFINNDGSALHGQLGPRAATTSGIRLLLAGLAFLQQVVPGTSVTLPLADRDMLGDLLQADDCPDDIQGSLDGKYVKGDLFFAQHEAEQAQHCWDECFTPPSVADDFWLLDEQPLLTLLDQAKDDDFHCLCGELAWFLRDLAHRPVNECDGHVASPVWSVHSRGCCVQCTDQPDMHLACQMSQTVGTTEQPSSQSGSLERVTLELQSALPSSCLVSNVGQSFLSCGVDRDMLDLLVERHRLDQLCQDLFPTPDMHEHAQLALRSTPAWNKVDAFSRVALFTDGSFKEGHPLVAHSVVGLVQVDGQWQFAGYLSGAVDTSDPATPLRANAHVAELCGMIHARLIHIAVGDQSPLEICYDCMSACQVMCLGSPKGSPIDNLAASLEAICFLRGIQPVWSHVAGHSGHPWNEVADCLAKRQLHAVIGGQEVASDLVQDMLREGYMKWLWLALASSASPACWPSAQDDGSFSSGASSRNKCHQPEVRRPEVLCQRVFNIRVVTYNTLSMRVNGQAECLEQHFGNNGCCILGLQECRQAHEGLEHGSHFFKLASPPLHGQGGCQIWLSKFAHPGVDASGNPLKWQSETFVKHHASHRCLSISGVAGDLRFGIVVAHAPTASSNREDIQRFWRQLAIITGQLPETSVKLVLIDASASFDPGCWERLYYQPLDDNAKEMVPFLEQSQLVPSDLWDEQGNAVKTWRSPSGYEKALDYVLIPRDMALHLRTVGVDLNLLDLFADIDHRPLAVHLSFAIQAQASGRDRRSFNVRAMYSNEGQAKLRDIFHGAPEIPWDAHACDHWQQLQDYLTAQCAKAFPHVSRGPRKTYISDPLWDLIVRQRKVRGQLRQRSQQYKKDFMWVCFCAWATSAGVDQQLHFQYAGSLRRFPRRRRQQDHYVASLWNQLTVLRKDIGQLMKQCQANRARQAFQDARDDGPSAMARLMTSLLKSGRRYKPPQTLPPIKDAAGNLITEQANVFRALGDHFAKAEKAVAVEQREFDDFMCAVTEHHAAELDGSLVPSVAELSAAFRKTKTGKAPGASGLRPEVFKFAPTPAAIVMYPLLLKQLMRGEIPTAFLRSQICPIPKPGKCPTSVEGWRSIALQEIPHKAACSTTRRFLLQALDRLALPLQLGGRPGWWTHDGPVASRRGAPPANAPVEAQCWSPLHRRRPSFLLSHP